MKICVYAGAEHAIDDNRTLKSVELFSEFSEVVYIYNSLFERDFEAIKKQYADKAVSFIGIRKNGNGLRSLSDFDKEAFRHIVECNADVWYVHNFFTANPMKIFRQARKRAKKIIYEIHEYVPEDFAENKISNPFLLNQKRRLMLFLFKKMIKNSDAVVTINRYILDMAVKACRPSYLLPNLASFGIEPKCFSERKNRLVLAGSTKKDLSATYAIISEINKRSDSPVMLDVIGLENTSAAKFINSVKFMPYAQMMQEISGKKFSLLTFRTYNRQSKNDIYCLPIKFFDSLGAGTPVIVDSYFKEMAYWTEKFGVGVVIDSSKPEKAAEKILEAMQEKKYSVFIQNIKANQSMFVWNEERKKDFLSFIREVLKT